jgi:D-glycero-D-manno-heptose 1,7-bisphosphate phosphatase
LSPTRVVILDRDGVLNELVARPPDGRGESPLTPGEVHLSEGVGEALHRIRRAGYLLACVTNQPSAAKGECSVAQVDAVQARVLDLLRHEGIDLDAVRLCPHHPDAADPNLRGPCLCRKPAPGMLDDVLHELDADHGTSWMIGDTDADMMAGRAAGVRTVLIRNPDSVHKRAGNVHPDAMVADLGDAVTVVVAGFGARIHSDQ